MFQLARRPTSRKIRGLLWFDKYDDGMDWPIETSGSATSAFAAGIASSRYQTNGYAQLSGLQPVPVPTGS